VVEVSCEYSKLRQLNRVSPGTARLHSRNLNLGFSLQYSAYCRSHCPSKLRTLHACGNDISFPSSLLSALCTHLSANHVAKLSPTANDNIKNTTSVPQSANWLSLHRAPKLPFPKSDGIGVSRSCTKEVESLYLHVQVWIVSILGELEFMMWA